MFSCLSVEGERGERPTDGGDAADDPRLPGTNTPPFLLQCLTLFESILM